MKTSLLICFKKPIVVLSAGKLIASFFWNVKSTVFLGYLQNGHTFNEKYCTNMLRLLRKLIKTKNPGRLTKWVWFHQDSAPTHKSLISMVTVRDCIFELVEHLSCSPDLSTSGYNLFLNTAQSSAGVIDLFFPVTMNSLRKFYEAIL